MTSSEQAIIQELQDAVMGQASAATFAVGGQIPIKTSGDVNKCFQSDSEADDTDDVLRAQRPIQIRFGANGKGMTLTLPTSEINTTSTSTPSPNPRQLRATDPSTVETTAKLQSLLAACAPASFGRGGEEVHDESYRKAGKLDTTEFATTFCPYNAGIIDVIQQVLLPHNLLKEGDRGIRAELYKLNVYSAPSGMFKAHVDTPRSRAQIGSLVIALPVEHQGGELIVRHQCGGILKRQIFDWSQSSADAPTIKWAAFYSDCEHEVRKVTFGHRITLTYNIFATFATGYLAGDRHALDATQLPLYKSLSHALSRPQFLSGGKILALNLTHHYAHTSETGNHLPYSLKGADMAIYEVASALHLTCYLRPLYEWESRWTDERKLLLGGAFKPFRPVDGQCSEEAEEYDRMHNFLEAKEEWEQEQVIWLNQPDPKGELPQAALVAYGNEPEALIKYTRAVLLIKIPPFAAGGRPPLERQRVFGGIRSSRTRDEDAEEGKARE